MEFVNLAIITVEDLKHVDEQIGKLEDDLGNKKDEVQAKINNKSFEHGKTSEEVGFIMEQLTALDVQDLESSVQKLSELEDKYGPLEVFKDLKGLYQTRGQNLSISKFLEQAEAIERQISGLLMGVIEDYEKIKGNITALDYDSVPEDIAEQVKGVLYDQLNERIFNYKNNLLDQLNKLLEGINWLGTDFNTDKLTRENLASLNSLIAMLISLQIINHRPIYPDTWWAIDSLLKPFVDRFNYHFTTNKETNKISKPEWAFNYVEEF